MPEGKKGDEQALERQKMKKSPGRPAYFVATKRENREEKERREKDPNWRLEQQ